MGIESSLPKEMSLKLNTNEIRLLAKRFRKLDVNNSGTLNIHEMMSLSELKDNVLAQRVFDIFDTDGSGEVNFTEFIQGISLFSSQGDKTDKLRLAFRIYDLDNDGFISREDIYKIMRILAPDNFKDVKLHQVVNTTFLLMGKGEDAKITFEEFHDLVGKSNGYKRWMSK